MSPEEAISRTFHHKPDFSIRVETHVGALHREIDRMSIERAALDAEIAKVTQEILAAGKLAALFEEHPVAERLFVAMCAPGSQEAARAPEPVTEEPNWPGPPPADDLPVTVHHYIAKPQIYSEPPPIANEDEVEECPVVPVVGAVERDGSVSISGEPASAEALADVPVYEGTVSQAEKNAGRVWRLMSRAMGSRVIGRLNIPTTATQLALKKTEVSAAIDYWRLQGKIEIVETLDNASFVSFKLV